MIEVKNLVKRYGDHIAVDNLSFHIESGQIWGFLGPNGAGKSTTMNIMTGYIAATEGDVKINGFDIYEEPEKAKSSIGYLPEQPPVYMDMTPEEYLKFVAELRKLPKRERKDAVEEAMRKTQIISMRKRLIRNLSKGYRQRVGLAQAILGDPQVIILDEPTVGLDPKQIIEIRDLIRDLAKHHTVILSSHILAEVSAICDHVLIIDKGRLIACDTTENLSEGKQNTTFIDVVVKAEAEKVKTVLNAVSGIIRYEILRRENGELALSIECEEDEKIRERISYELVVGGCPMLSMGVRRQSLEDIFLRLTQEGEASEIEGNVETEDIIQTEDTIQTKDTVQTKDTIIETEKKREEEKKDDGDL